MNTGTVPKGTEEERRKCTICNGTGVDTFDWSECRSCDGIGHRDIMEEKEGNMNPNSGTVPLDEIRKALDAASTQYEWDTDGTFIAWKDGHPLKGTYRQIALTQALTPEMFRNENHDNDAHLIANAPTWLRSLLEENERLQKHVEKFINGERQRLSQELEQVKKERDAWEKSSKDQFSELFTLRSELAEYRKVLEWYGEEMPHAGSITSKALIDKGIKARSILSQYAKETES